MGEERNMSNNNRTQTPGGNGQQAARLDDESRVKVLSPSMLVMKRFVRNRLAITGLVIIIVMFIFSFIGGYLMPYTQTQVFRKYDAIPKEYASAIFNEELRYVAPEGKTFPQSVRTQFILALNKNAQDFTADGVSYRWEKSGEEYYRIWRHDELGMALGIGGSYAYTPANGTELAPELVTAFEAAQAAKETTFQLGGETYAIGRSGKSVSINRVEEAALASTHIYDAYEQANTALISGYAFRLAVEETVEVGGDAFELAGVSYTLESDEDNVTIYRVVNGAKEPFAIASELVTQAASPDVFITVPFKNAVLDAIQDGVSTFTFPDENGEDVTYAISRVLKNYTIKRDTVTQLIDMYAPPSAEHLLGTDGNGMDVLTRLMYGGRISLLVGFVVVFIELVIGVIIGGVAGYFGGWIDTLLMRFIDLFNCIPYWPVMIIVGAVMDSFEIDPTARIFLLMLILGVLGWTGIARVVRGQILSLREQDFMVATEATGIRVTRRIFRHLVPNVMPLLIVQATMSLGGVIITEATLSFLGLGLKYPMASWGSIINSATDVYIMTNYWFMWLPAGMLILLTVLGFNFVGDGLRDAFDPKMKR